MKPMWMLLYVLALAASATPARASSPGPHGIRFVPGEPAGHTPLTQALGPADSFRDLVAALEVLRTSGYLGTIEVAGYSDAGECTEEADCGALSLRRAQMIRDWLVAGGIPASRFQVSAWGSKRPLEPGDSAEARSRNRRVELTVPAMKPARRGK